jgi:hypothetical protein
MNEAIAIDCTADRHPEGGERSDVLRDAVLPSGRSIVVKIADQQEELLVRSPDGEVEVRITLTKDGPVLKLRAARLELESPESVAVNCRRFSVNSTEGTNLHSGGNLHLTGHELRVQTESDMHFNGGVIRLNC